MQSGSLKSVKSLYIIVKKWLCGLVTQHAMFDVRPRFSQSFCLLYAIVVGDSEHWKAVLFSIKYFYLSLMFKCSSECDFLYIKPILKQQKYVLMSAIGESKMLVVDSAVQFSSAFCSLLSFWS